MRRELVLSVSPMGEPSRVKADGVHVNRKRTATHPHDWRDGRCKHCGMLNSPEWPGARRPCEAVYAAHRARGEAKQKAIATALRMLRGRNDETPAVDAARASGTATSMEPR